jgi:DNA-binding PadR family transcriptional regulator
MSRYDVASTATRTINNFWTIAKSQVYAELDRLERLGYVKSTHVRQRKLPDKRLFELTPEGRSAFKDWLEESETEVARFRSAYLVKVFFARDMSKERLIQLLRDYRDRNDEWRMEIEAISDRLQGKEDAVYMRSTALLGARMASAMVAWAEETLAGLDPKVRPRRRAPRR